MIIYHKGHRETMEDTHVVEANGCFAAIFDGHGGGDIAK
jgi:serine/threonine protein phosphatase PrpC